MSDSQPTPKRTRDQQKFIDWARQHLRDWEQRDADMLEACKQHQLARECRECIRLGGCVRYACEGQPCREWSGPLPLPMPSHWPEVQRNFGGEKQPRK